MFGWVIAGETFEVLRAVGRRGDTPTSQYFDNTRMTVSAAMDDVSSNIYKASSSSTKRNVGKDMRIVILRYLM